jgi:hypothetical protein
VNRHLSMSVVIRGRWWRPAVGPNVASINPTTAETAMTPLYAVLGILLVLIAIPLGLMLAPLIVGAILIAIGIRRADRAIQPNLTAGAA